MHQKSFLGSEYALATAFFTELERMRHVWHLFRSPSFNKGDLMLLGAVHEHMFSHGEPLAMSKLAHIMKQSPPAISRRVGMLEEQGYLSRTGDEQDRRVTYVALTPKGKAASEKIMRKFFSHIEKTLLTMGEEKAATLTQLMHEFGNSMESMLPSTTHPEHANTTAPQKGDDTV